MTELKHAHLITILNSINSDELNEFAERLVEDQEVCLGGLSPGEHVDSIFRDAQQLQHRHGFYQVLHAADSYDPNSTSQFNNMRRLLASIAVDALYAIACIDAGELDQQLHDYVSEQASLIRNGRARADKRLADSMKLPTDRRHRP